MTRGSLALTTLALALALTSVACGGTVVTGGAGGNGSGGPTTASSGQTTLPTTTGTSSSSSSSTSTSSSGSIEPPPPPPSGGVPGAGSVTFAVSKLYFGDTDRDGTPDKANGWKQYGFDLDHRISTASSTDLCKPRNGASPKFVYPDGDGGIDNSFGKLILPIFLGLESSFTSNQNISIAAGHTTILFDLQALGAGAVQSPLAARMYAGANLGHAPLWNGLDQWPFEPASLVQLPMGYLTADTWVGPAAGPMVVTVDFGTVSLPLTILGGRIAMNLDPTHTSATSGTIAGILPVDTLVTAIQTLAGSLDPSLCSGPTIDSITFQIAQAADILVSGDQDPTQTCDGISIGLGFDAKAVQLGSAAPAVPPPPPPCGG